MVNYNDIQNHFGKPLNNIPSPRTPQQIKLWHVAAVGIIAYFVYKGIVYTIQENSNRPRMKED